jgi:phage baseplate assembly protein W
MTETFGGVGWAFPIRVASGTGQIADLPVTPVPPAPGERLPVELAREERAIRESILLIVGTRRGERVMRPDFGCGLHDLVFEPNNAITVARATLAIRDSLVDFEPRIEVLDVRAAADPEEAGKLVISLEYRIRSSNTVFNLVYPFYLQTPVGQAP